MPIARILRVGGVLALLAGCATADPAQRADPGSPTALVDALEAAGGVHPGARRAHAKGMCATGEWQATGAAARLSVAPSLAAGFSAPIIARLSLASGNPAAADSGQLVRGLAFDIPLAGGGAHQFAVLSVPVFGYRQPEDFAASLLVQIPEPATGRPNAERVAAFNAAHPENAGIFAWLRQNPPGGSHATTAFFGVHTFFLVDAAGRRTPVRWRFEPVAGREPLSAEARQRLGANFLEPELRARLARGPVEWRVFMALGQPGDFVIDPTAAWPAERPELEVARLRIVAMPPAGVPGPCDPLQFSPTVLPPGIEPSDDPVLRARGPAYGVSVARRKG